MPRYLKEEKRRSIQKLKAHLLRLSLCCYRIPPQVTCRRPGLKLTVVSTAEKNSVFLRKKVLISYGSRWCVKLLPESKFTTEALERLPVYSDITNINRISITEIILYLWEIALENERTGIDFVNKINFHDSTLSSLPDSLKLL